MYNYILYDIIYISYDNPTLYPHHCWSISLYFSIFGRCQLTLVVGEVRDVERHYVDGWYTVLYDGEGILDFNMDVTCVHRIARNHIRIWS